MILQVRYQLVGEPTEWKAFESAKTNCSSWHRERLSEVIYWEWWLGELENRLDNGKSTACGQLMEDFLFKEDRNWIRCAWNWFFYCITVWFALHVVIYLQQRMLEMLAIENVIRFTFIASIVQKEELRKAAWVRSISEIPMQFVLPEALRPIKP